MAIACTRILRYNPRSVKRPDRLKVCSLLKDLGPEHNEEIVGVYKSIMDDWSADAEYRMEAASHLKEFGPQYKELLSEFYQLILVQLNLRMSELWGMHRQMCDKQRLMDQAREALQGLESGL